MMTVDVEQGGQGTGQHRRKDDDRGPGIFTTGTDRDQGIPHIQPHSATDVGGKMWVWV